jgi:hypothetical protein
MQSLPPTGKSRHTVGLCSYIPHSMVFLSRAAHQPSSQRAMIRPPHRSASVNSGGTSSSPRIITSSLQQLALHEAHVMTAPSLTSVELDSACILLTMVNVLVCPGCRSLLHSINLSARNMIESGIFMPSALAVFMLITSSNLVGCSIGRSPGLAPLNMRST